MTSEPFCIKALCKLQNVRVKGENSFDTSSKLIFELRTVYCNVRINSAHSHMFYILMRASHEMTMINFLSNVRSAFIELIRRK